MCQTEACKATFLACWATILLRRLRQVPEEPEELLGHSWTKYNPHTSPFSLQVHVFTSCLFLPWTYIKTGYMGLESQFLHLNFKKCISKNIKPVPTKCLLLFLILSPQDSCDCTGIATLYFKIQKLKTSLSTSFFHPRGSIFSSSIWFSHETGQAEGMAQGEQSFG